MHRKEREEIWPSAEELTLRISGHLERGKQEARSHGETKVPRGLKSPGSRLLGEEGIGVRSGSWRRGVKVHVNICCSHGGGGWVGKLTR